MAIVLGNNTIEGVQRLSGTGASYGITQDSTGRVRFPLNPCFRAYGSPDTTSGNAVIWSSVLYNIGDHYTQATGRFTAPITGNYFFAFSNIGSNDSVVWRYYPRVNGSRFLGGYQLRLDAIHNDSGDRYNPNGAKTAIISLSANDYVDIEYVSSATQYANSGQTFAYFMGYLIG